MHDDGIEEPVARLWNAVRSHPVPLLVIAGIALRLPFVEVTSINADAGFYIYDSFRILEGKTPFIDYPARSPAFQYTLAGVIATFGFSITVARGFMIVLSIALGLGVYLLGQEIHSQAAGTTAALLYYLTPGAMMWSLWLGPEQFAQLIIILTCTYALRSLKTPCTSGIPPLVIGIGIGLALLAETFVITSLSGFGIFMSIALVRDVEHKELKLARYFSILAIGTAATLLFWYLALALPSISSVANIADQHLLDSIIKRPETPFNVVNSKGTGSTFGEGIGTERHWLLRLGDHVHLILPVLLPLLVALHRLPRIMTPPVVLTVGFVAGTSLQPSAGLLVLITTVAVWIASKETETERPLNRKTLLPLSILATTLIGGLLYGPEPLPLYLQNVIPYLAVIAGTLIVDLYEIVEFESSGATEFVLLLVVVLTIVQPFVLAPLSLPINNPSVGYVQTVGQDLADRTNPGDRIFAAQTHYVTESGRKPAADLSHEYQRLIRAPSSPESERLKRQILANIGTSTTPYVILEDRMETLFDEHPGVQRLVRACYEPLSDGPGRMFTLEVLELTRDDECLSAREDVIGSS
jgi:hypothetical protein